MPSTLILMVFPDLNCHALEISGADRIESIGWFNNSALILIRYVYGTALGVDY